MCSCYEPRYRTFATSALTAAESSMSVKHKDGERSVTKDTHKSTMSIRKEGIEILQNLLHVWKTFFSLMRILAKISASGGECER